MLTIRGRGGGWVRAEGEGPAGRGSVAARTVLAQFALVAGRSSLHRASRPATPLRASAARSMSSPSPQTTQTVSRSPAAVRRKAPGKRDLVSAREPAGRRERERRAARVEDDEVERRARPGRARDQRLEAIAVAEDPERVDHALPVVAHQHEGDPVPFRCAASRSTAAAGLRPMRRTPKTSAAAGGEDGHARKKAPAGRPRVRRPRRLRACRPRGRWHEGQRRQLAGLVGIDARHARRARRARGQVRGEALALRLRRARRGEIARGAATRPARRCSAGRHGSPPASGAAVSLRTASRIRSRRLPTVLRLRPRSAAISSCVMSST